MQASFETQSDRILPVWCNTRTRHQSARLHAEREVPQYKSYFALEADPVSLDRLRGKDSSCATAVYVPRRQDLMLQMSS